MTDLASTIDHTILKPEATGSDIERLCVEAREHRFASVCVNRYWVESCWRLLRDSDVAVCAVAGFPLGATSPTVKAFEATEAVSAGADEVDMVIAVGPLREGRHDIVRAEIADVVRACQGRLVKVIIEASLLTDEEKVAACKLSMEAGAHFVKTSTGFGPGGATVEDVALMRSTVGDALGVKASGGIRTRADAEAMIRAGASRLGTSSGVAIVTP